MLHAHAQGLVVCALWDDRDLPEFDFLKVGCAEVAYVADEVVP
jgi:hypothetical protein